MQKVTKHGSQEVRKTRFIDEIRDMTRYETNAVQKEADFNRDIDYKRDEITSQNRQEEKKAKDR